MGSLFSLAERCLEGWEWIPVFWDVYGRRDRRAANAQCGQGQCDNASWAGSREVVAGKCQWGIQYGRRACLGNWSRPFLLKCRNTGKDKIYQNRMWLSAARACLLASSDKSHLGTTNPPPQGNTWSGSGPVRVGVLYAGAAYIHRGPWQVT
jgi:hypothetical protein